MLDSADFLHFKTFPVRTLDDGDVALETDRRRRRRSGFFSEGELPNSIA